MSILSNWETCTTPLSRSISSITYMKLALSEICSPSVTSHTSHSSVQTEPFKIRKRGCSSLRTRPSGAVSRMTSSKSASSLSSSTTRRPPLTSCYRRKQQTLKAGSRSFASLPTSAGMRSEEFLMTTVAFSLSTSRTWPSFTAPRFKT